MEDRLPGAKEKDAMLRGERKIPRSFRCGMGCPVLLKCRFDAVAAVISKMIFRTAAQRLCQRVPAAKSLTIGGTDFALAVQKLRLKHATIQRLA